MSGALEGKIAIVTGGANGIGRATVELFVAEGARVVVADIDAALGKEVANNLGASAAFFRADVSKRDEVQALVDFTVGHFGGLHVMCNNAAKTTRTERLLEDDLHSWDAFFAVNVMGVAYGSRSAALHMRDHGGGSIINMSSVASVMPGLGFIPYRATKAALNNLTKSMAIDLAEYGIRVNALAPGSIRTTIMDYREPDMTDEDVVRVRAATDSVLMAYQPLKAANRPRDVAEAALFLAGDRSRQITGVILPVDGGITAGDAVNRFEEVRDARRQAIAEIRAERE